PYILDRFLLRAARSQAEIDKFCGELIRAHLHYLEQFNCPVTLITDVEFLTVSGEGRVVERKDALRGNTLPCHGEEWIWRVAPHPDSEVNLEHRVVGIPNLKAALRPPEHQSPS